jgi:U3 small nucleolar RNA-associated protein 10
MARRIVRPIFLYGLLCKLTSEIEELQYLDKDDLVRYLDALLEQKDHFHGDAGYLALFHGQYLVKNAGDRKRDSE